MITPQAILDFWFAPEHEAMWFNATPDMDAEIRERYQSVWEAARDGELEDWRNTPEGCLALIIVLDQFPLNMFRDDARRYSTAEQALTIAKQAVARGWDQGLSPAQISFLYMPYMHSENLDDQDQSVALYETTGIARKIHFAKHHRDIVRRFGRFPHRNAALGRASTPEEIAYLDSKEAFKA